MHDAASLRLAHDGAEHLPGAAAALLPDLMAALADLPSGVPGLRLAGIPQLTRLLEAGGAVGRVAARNAGVGAKPVRALLFDKSTTANWALGWHQDRTIAVEARREIAGFGPWTIKRGMPHVAPPFALLAAMTTLRIHLDDVPADNAPLLIAPGSHRGLVREHDIDGEVAARGTCACLAVAGDIWAYATPILHASEAAARPARRRVLQVDYATGDLPGGLCWLGV